MLEAVAGEVLRKGWFVIPGTQYGDRSVDEQAIGLENYDFTGKTVLDLGCAEGLISAYALMHGAALVHGCEIIGDHIKVAAKLMVGRPCHFWVMDLNRFEDLHRKSLRRGVPPMLHRYDVVLMLAIAHKMKEPVAFIEYAATLSDSLIIRLPAKILSDKRSNFQNTDIPLLLSPNFDLVSEPSGPRGEWMGIFQRHAHHG